MKGPTVFLFVLALGLSGCLVSHSSETTTSGGAPKLTKAQKAAKDARIAELEREIAELQEKYDELLAQMAKIEKRRGSGWRSDGWMEVPALGTKVIAVDAEKNEILLGVGRDDGVKVGFDFTIYRGDKYVGKVIIQRVADDSCVGESKIELQARPIEVGDGARTRW